MICDKLAEISNLLEEFVQAIRNKVICKAEIIEKFAEKVKEFQLLPSFAF